ncbi:2-isopropylmalate synthase [Magnetococcus sp. PR-3]|uniref:2-isopropylmalate synthase n=1 Tax=Magnetococcus sp. PR-3 TaxID=3120355 RepID=UPI002FCE155C
MTMPFNKYTAYPPIDLPNRQWPTRTLQQAPTWCSVDLRDGNQALANPMGPEAKRRMFDLLVKIGFKEIEIGFPSASRDDFQFLRDLIEQNAIPDDVTVQMLVQSRAHLIERTFEALQGAKRAIVHLYTPTSTLQRRVVFNKSQQEIIDVAVEGTRMIKEHAQRCSDTEIVLEFSPESFTGTELDFALRISEAVQDAWQPTPDNPLILNLPATVEMSTPNIYADQIEWVRNHLKDPDSVVISLHAHNDRGTAVAATELAMLAGAGRVEGTLFGNGERTGNTDIVAVAMNLHSQGIDPELDFSDMPNIIQTSESCTGMDVPPRQPYAGELVFTAFSGSHQDAIRKGLHIHKEEQASQWTVPYLPIDPEDLGRHYEPVIRINSQSGKGGMAFVMEERCGIHMPKSMQVEFSRVVQSMADEMGRELEPEEIERAFFQNFVMQETPYQLGQVEHREESEEVHHLHVDLTHDQQTQTLQAQGTGPMSALVNALEASYGHAIRIHDYHQHARTAGRDSEAVSFVQITIDGSDPIFGVGVHTDSSRSALEAVLCSINRALASH